MTSDGSLRVRQAQSGMTILGALFLIALLAVGGYFGYQWYMGGEDAPTAPPRTPGSTAIPLAVDAICACITQTSAANPIPSVTEATDNVPFFIHFS